MTVTRYAIQLNQDISRLLREKYAVADSSGAAFDITRLLRGEPLDYVIGWAPFLDAAIDLSLYPFIPRSETEFWVRTAIERYASRGREPFCVLDMFSGSGAIAVAWAIRFPADTVIAAEKESRFVRQIGVNREKNRISPKRFHIVHSDFFKNIRGKFNVILANPPYVGAMNRLDPTVRVFEPRVAYYGGEDGLKAIRRFLKDAKQYLAPDGEIWMEYGSGQKSAVKTLLQKNGYWRCTFYRDQYGRWRYVVAGIGNMEF